MKLQVYSLLLPLPLLLLVGCNQDAGPGVFLPLVGGAAGGGLGYVLADDEDQELGAAIGALGGYTVGKLAQSGQRKQRTLGFEEGYAKGKSDSVKTLYWAKRDAQRNDDEPPVEYRYYEVPVPAHITSDGVLVDAHYRVIEVVE